MNHGFGNKKYYYIVQEMFSHKFMAALKIFFKGATPYDVDAYDTVVSDISMLIERYDRRVVDELRIGKLSHLALRLSAFPINLYLVYDLGLGDENFLNRMKLKSPSMSNNIYPDDHDFVTMLKYRYEKGPIGDHNVFTTFIL